MFYYVEAGGDAGGNAGGCTVWHLLVDALCGIYTIGTYDFEI